MFKFFASLLLITGLALADTPPPIYIYDAPLSRSGSHVSIPQATSSVSGYLSATDFAAFSTSSATFSQSLVKTAGVVTLVNDSATPGNSKYYGTDGTGARGYFALPTLLSQFTNDTGFITNAGADARISLQKAQPNGLATLDGAGLIPSAQLPPLAITNTFIVSSQAAMLALSATIGDVAVRTDTNTTFILQSSPPSTLGNWVQLLNPAAPVQSVNGQTGTVNLTTSNISEGSNLYFTNARAQGAVSATAPLVDTAGVFSIPVATNSVNGYLSSANWTTFNNKQNALGYTPVNKAGDTITGNLAVNGTFNVGSTSIFQNDVRIYDGHTLNWGAGTYIVSNSGAMTMTNGAGSLGMDNPSSGGNVTLYSGTDNSGNPGVLNLIGHNTSGAPGNSSAGGPVQLIGGNDQVGGSGAYQEVFGADGLGSGGQIILQGGGSVSGEGGGLIQVQGGYIGTGLAGNVTWSGGNSSMDANGVLTLYEFGSGTHGSGRIYQTYGGSSQALILSAASNSDLTVQPPISLADGIAFASVDDSNSVNLSMEFRASQYMFWANPVTIQSTLSVGTGTGMILNNGVLQNLSGTPTIDVHNGFGTDVSGNRSVDFRNRQLQDSSGNIRHSWDSTGNTLTGNLTVSGPSIGTGFLKVNGSGTVSTGGTRTLTTSGAITSSDYFVFGNSASPLTITLPSAATASQVYIIKNINTGTVTLTPNGTDQIDGLNASLTLSQYTAYNLVSSGGAWYIW